MPRDPRVLLDDMLDALRRIEVYTNGFQAGTLEDVRTLDAVLRNLEVLGEAAKNMPEAARSSWPQVEWRKIAGLRDVIAHQYFGIDDNIIKDVVAKKLPALANALRSVPLD